MYNKAKIEVLSSQVSDFQNYVNRNVVELLLDSHSSMGVTQEIESGETKTLVDFSSPINVVGSTLTISNISSSSYKLSLDTGFFNTPVDVGLLDTSLMSVASTDGQVQVSCPDFDLSGVSSGDLLIFHENENSPASINTQGNVVKIVGVDAVNNKLYANDPFGMASENFVIDDTSFFSVFKNEITSSHTISLSSGFKEKNIGYYNIVSATDTYVIINTDKTLIEDSTPLTAGSLSVFSKVIGSVFLHVNNECDVLIDNTPTTVGNVSGNGVLFLTSKCSSIAVRNTGELKVKLTMVYSTSIESNSCGV